MSDEVMKTPPVAAESNQYSDFREKPLGDFLDGMTFALDGDRRITLIEHENGYGLYFSPDTPDLQDVPQPDKTFVLGLTPEAMSAVATMYGLKGKHERDTAALMQHLRDDLRDALTEATATAQKEHTEEFHDRLRIAALKMVAGWLNIEPLDLAERIDQKAALQVFVSNTMIEDIVMLIRRSTFVGEQVKGGKVVNITISVDEARDIVGLGECTCNQIERSCLFCRTADALFFVTDQWFYNMRPTDPVTLVECAEALVASRSRKARKPKTRRIMPNTFCRASRCTYRTRCCRARRAAAATRRWCASTICSPTRGSATRTARAGRSKTARRSTSIRTRPACRPAKRRKKVTPMSTTRSEGVAHVATTFGGETCAEAMREAARFVARCERGISDIIVGTNDDGEPIVTVYEELERTDANTIACQLVEEFAPTDDGVHDWSRLRQMIADAIMQPLKGV